MIFPFGDTPQPPRGYVAWVNWLLIAVNVAVFLFLTVPLSVAAPDPSDPAYAVLRDRLRDLVPYAQIGPLTAWDVAVERWGFVPDRPSVATLFSSMFMHANFAHLFGNMLFLWIYGDNVEHRIGRVPYLLSYLFTGVVATVTFAMFARDGATPLVGASGAISGALGAYFVMFPRNRIKLFVLIPPLFLTTFLVPAPFVLGAYVLLDNLLPFLTTSGGSVAYGAHLGGFVAGVGLAWLAERRLGPVSPRSEGAEARAAFYVDQGDRLADLGQDAAALSRYQTALDLTNDPALAARARRGIRRLRIHPRMADRYEP